MKRLICLCLSLVMVMFCYGCSSKAEVSSVSEDENISVSTEDNKAPDIPESDISLHEDHQSDTDANDLLSFDKKETIGDIQFSVSSTWECSVDDTESIPTYTYFPEKKEFLLVTYVGNADVFQNSLTSLGPDVFYKNIYNSLTSSSKDATLVSSLIVDIDSYPAAVFDYRDTIDDEEVLLHQFEFLYSDKLYLFTMSDFSGMDKYFSSILEHIQIVDPSSGSDDAVSQVDDDSNSIFTPSQTVTASQEQALDKAASYLKHSCFSHNGLINQLEYSGFTHDDAVFAADNCGADWMEQSLKKASSYLKHSAFSYEGLIHQLEYSEFTHDEAVYAADNCGADWMEQALLKANSYLEHSAFSYVGLIKQLEYSKFTHDQAIYAADNCGADWMEQAVSKAQSYISHSDFTYDRLVSQLEYSGFTHEEAVHGASSVQ